MTPYEKRVIELENEGLTTSDAQGIASVEFAKKHSIEMLQILEEMLSKLKKPEERNK